MGIIVVQRIHSQKQSAHWAVDVTAQMVPCWLGSWLNHNFWLVIGQRAQLAFQLIQLDITWVHCLYVADSGNTQLSGRKISWVTCIGTPESSLHLISPLNCISTETWLRWWFTVGGAVSSESVWWCIALTLRVSASVWVSCVTTLMQIEKDAPIQSSFFRV